MFEFFEAFDHRGVLLFRNALIGLVTELTDNFDGVLLFIELINATIDPSMVADSYELFALI